MEPLPISEVERRIREAEQQGNQERRLLLEALLEVTKRADEARRDKIKAEQPAYQIPKKLLARSTRSTRLDPEDVDVTTPHETWRPEYLRPCSNFLKRQRDIFGALYNNFPPQSRVFKSLSFLFGLAGFRQGDIAELAGSSSKELVEVIIEELNKVEGVHNEFNIGNGLILDSYPHRLSYVSEEVVANEPPAISPRREITIDRWLLNKIQTCVYQTHNGLEGPNTMLYIWEFKPPQKLTVPHLRLGLRPMDVVQEAANRTVNPPAENPDVLFQYHADRLEVTAVAQTYHYMIEGGLEYGMLTTGEAIIFLRIDWRHPETLYYHLVEPGPEVSANSKDAPFCTALAQYLAFNLMALGQSADYGPYTQEARIAAMSNLSKWTEDFETISLCIPGDQIRAPDGSLAHKPTTYADVDRSPRLCHETRRRISGVDLDEKETFEKDPPKSPVSAPNPPDTPRPEERRSHGGQGTRHSQRIVTQRSREGGEELKYCTQKCLLGLVTGAFLDQSCPNVALHCRKDENCHKDSRNRHPVDHTQWYQLLWKQMKRSLHDGIKPLGVNGSRGALLRVSLVEYGYTFVSKGTVRAFIPHLEYEAQIYRHLRPIQGTYVPVFLGAIDLGDMDKIYYYDHRVYVVHMTFLSWGGA